MSAEVNLAVRPRRARAASPSSGRKTSPASRQFPQIRAI